MIRALFVSVAIAAAALLGYAAGRQEARFSAHTAVALHTAALGAASQPTPATAAVRGRVVDERGEPVRGAVVVADPLDRGLVRARSRSRIDPAREGVVTDEAGRFALGSLPPGRYVFVALHGRHSPGKSGPIAISGEFPARLKITLGGEWLPA